MSHAIPKRQLREQRRAERQAKEAAERARATRKRRLFQLGGALGLAAVVLVAAIAISSSGGTKPAAPSPGLLAGIPEHNGVLGAPNAKTTVTEFVDLQCPICAKASQTVVPPIIRDYVRPGDVKLQARTLSFIGPDSVARRPGGRRCRAAGSAVAVPGDVLRQAGRGELGLRHRRLPALGGRGLRRRREQGARLCRRQHVADAAHARNAEAQKLGVNGTPTFVVQHGNGKPQVVSADKLAAALAQ